MKIISPIGFTGIFWCVIFATLDAGKAVFLGSFLQRIDGFLLGATVFGLTALVSLIWILIFRFNQLVLVAENLKSVIGFNITCAVAWALYFNAVQLLEPAIAFSLFVGMIPITTIAAKFCGAIDGQKPRNVTEWAGNLSISFAVVYLCVITAFGLTGFETGNGLHIILGCSSAIFGGIFIAGMLLLGQKLHRVGLDPLTQYAMRWPLYIVMALVAYSLNIDNKGPMVLSDFIYAVFIGFFLMAFPIYAVQKAISLSPSLTIAAFASLTPFLIFLLQQFDDERIALSLFTLIGLTLYFFGSSLAVYGSVSAGKSEQDN